MSISRQWMAKDPVSFRFQMKSSDCAGSIFQQVCSRSLSRKNPFTASTTPFDLQLSVIRFISARLPAPMACDT